MELHATEQSRKSRQAQQWRNTDYEGETMTREQIHAMQHVARRRAEREERRAREQRRKLTLAAVLAIIITYALTWAHYGLGY